jgi:hypothetical protein
MKGSTFLLAALTILTAYGFTPGRECRERALGTPTGELKRSAAVFTGTVIDVTKPRPDEHTEGGRVVYEDQLYVYVKFRVEKAWKGVGKSQLTITIRAEREEYGCGYDFQAGTYLVYADGIGRGRAQKLWIGCCTRTRRIEEAGEDLRKLGAGKAIGVGTMHGVTKPDKDIHPTPRHAASQ